MIINWSESLERMEQPAKTIKIDDQNGNSLKQLSNIAD